MLTFLIICAIFSLIGLIPAGVDLGLLNGDFSFKIKFAGLSFSLPKKKEGKEKKPEKEKKKKKKKAAPEKDENASKKKKKKKLDLKFIKNMTIIALKTLDKFRKRLSIDYIKIQYIQASSDPFKTAVSYGRANMAMGFIVPLIEKAFNVKDRAYDIELDFIEEKSRINFWLTATIQLWEIMYVVSVFVIAFIKLKINEKKENKSKNLEDERKA